ncbi:MAG TPA: right-handed parallel beta-helix repeat-containing protein, partial [Minicystis sp.]|nr:right-handed parallel beta-helix repeat-containing protein [Minicystis sp.]
GAGAGGPSGGGGGPPASGSPMLPPCVHVGQGTDYQVGPGKAYASIGDVPFESLGAGDTVRIFWRDQPYHEKMMVSGTGTKEQPVRVCGVPGPNGELPVIDGANATTRPQLDFPYDGHQPRGVIVVGHKHSDPWLTEPSNIVIEGLEIRNGSPENTFTDKSGQVQHYASDGAGIYVQRANGFTVRGCAVHDNNDGLFIGGGAGDELTQHVLVEANDVYQNGSLTDFYEHNIYNEVSDIVYQYNHLGSPRAGTQGVLGANIKERSAGVVIRYNWIEDGAHLLDIVDAQEAAGDTLPMASFHTTYVYGNVMIRNGDSGSMVLYGGDSGILTHYRKGTLYFYQNTVVVKNQAGHDYADTAVFELSTNDEHLQSINNVFYSAVTPTPVRPVWLLGRRDNVVSGVAAFANDWMSNGWTPWDQIPGNTAQVTATITGLGGLMQGTDPGFVDASSANYAPAAASPLVGAGQDLASVVPAADADVSQYVAPQNGEPRAPEAQPTLGAFAAP